MPICAKCHRYYVAYIPSCVYCYLDSVPDTGELLDLDSLLQPIPTQLQDLILRPIQNATRRPYYYHQNSKDGKREKRY